ncbi:hypothetical protein DPMN_127431 [Dreissena polymorpha]|uniref:Uncharacterized protein n=1 Tax=Dreissena polymorpha TaxID=45954 RepID=A0A9D4H1Y2_DREPO|nr:hypothetical protein DPMN_127431 [Dreissena polymorpha]
MTEIQLKTVKSRQTRKDLVILKTKHSENHPQDQYHFDDSAQDPDYKDDQADSSDSDSSDSDSSDSDGEPAVKKRKRNPKKKSTDEEKATLKPLVL